MAKKPDQCPHIKTCTLKVDEDQAEFVCDTESWIHCEAIKDSERARYWKKPSEWLEEKKELKTHG